MSRSGATLGGFLSIVSVTALAGCATCLTPPSDFQGHSCPCLPGYSCAADYRCYRSDDGGDSSDPTSEPDVLEADVAIEPAPDCGVCPPTESCCGSCVSTSNDSFNCGGCGTVCPGPLPLCCGGTCRRADNDPMNCAGCGVTCTGVQPACCSASCADLSSDPSNCGTCFTNCSAMLPFETCCSGTCTDRASDPSNCGSCGILCMGVSPDCCNGVCADLWTDSNHCGLCTLPCRVSAPTCCGGRCVNLQSDNGNCGSCGNACAGGLICMSGTCR